VTGRRSSTELGSVHLGVFGCALVVAGGVRTHGDEPAGYPQGGGGRRPRSTQTGRTSVLLHVTVGVPDASDKMESGGPDRGLTARRSGPTEAADPDQHGCHEDYEEGTDQKGEVEGHVVTDVVDDQGDTCDRQQYPDDDEGEEHPAVTDRRCVVGVVR